ncbi:ABC transporter permease [Actinobacteria bacterium YIM 96077]|uniref:ABC transporter permease n=1 Tax=Phytoactinopolyspora halophila TaxID=1981511 RepID=A0A329R3L1_9ACTN|nr:ABC transporter permease [Phytoactinopolyspora halophila]AYY12146.1 ABC transporter permease [Actinobacteria bacterium YIM 96077]RAW18619.1 ABC transporter permease [Phytoactinopolyspora halophila]
MTSTLAVQHRPGTSFVASTRAELLRLRKWPALWVLIAVWLLLTLLFGYVFDYIGYRTGGSSTINEGVPPELLLADLLPAAIPETALSGLPMFGGAIMMILGALTAGSGYSWGTWKTVFTQGPSRASAFGGALTAVAIAVVGIMVVTMLLEFAAATTITVLESEPLIWPSALDVVRTFGGGLLISGMWAAAGIFVGTLTRSPALAVGLGLVWALAVENLLRGVANVLQQLEVVTDVLPGTAAGSLAGAMGASAMGDGDGTPGVLTILDGGPAAALLGIYLVVFAALATWVAVRRDVT